MGLASYKIVGSAGEWRVSHDGKAETFIRRRSLHLRQQWRQLHSHFVRVMRCGYLLLVTAQRRVLQTQARLSSPAKGEGTEDGYRSQFGLSQRSVRQQTLLRRSARARQYRNWSLGGEAGSRTRGEQLSNRAQQRTPGVKLLTSRPLHGWRIIHTWGIGLSQTYRASWVAEKKPPARCLPERLLGKLMKIKTIRPYLSSICRYGQCYHSLPPDWPKGPGLAAPGRADDSN